MYQRMPYRYPSEFELGKSNMKRVLLTGLTIASSLAQAVLIDDFSVPCSNSILGSSWVGAQTGTMLSGERDVQLSISANPLNQFFDLDVPASGLLIVSNGFMSEGVATLQYDGVGDEVGNLGAGKILSYGGSGSPILGGSNDRIRIKFIGNDLDVKVTATSRLNGNILDSASATRSAGSGAGFLDLFVSSSALAAMDSLTLEFRGAPSADFALGSVEAVPEPTSTLVVVAGIWSLIFARRKA
jgi:hypothetical protein